VKRLLKQLDVYVLPSLWEGLPLSILEAMAASKPVVATDIKGNNELVLHDQTGFLVEPRNSNQIAEAVVKLLKNRGLAATMGQHGRQRVREHFDIDNTVAEVDFLYKSLLGRDAEPETEIYQAEVGCCEDLVV